jgi:hypothetical protein
MTGTTDAKTAVYTTLYNYTTTAQDENGNTITISSGVASYEPLIGGEENPFHQPVFYTTKSILQLDRFYYIEQPFGESLFPGPRVGYSKVTATTLDVGSQTSSTGTVVSEFYTAKDFPTRTSNTPLSEIFGSNSTIAQILFSKVDHSVGLSQGFVVENNDMHGKPKIESVYNKSGELISSTAYSYKTSNPTASSLDLSNQVQVVNPNGGISTGLLNQDIQYFTFMRDARSNMDGTQVQISGGAFAIGWFFIPFAFVGIGDSHDNRDLRSASTIKLVNDYGILDKVTKTINGSSITTQNLLYDSQTGDVVLTQTQNEFDDPVFNLNIPAYWMYPGMSQAYQNDGLYLENVAMGNTGAIQGSVSTLLQQGDEIVDLVNGGICWVTNSTGELRLINRDGTPHTNMLNMAKVVRSGFRNILSGSTATFATLANPIVGNQLDMSVASKVLDAKASLYTQTWNVPNAYCPFACPANYSLSADSTNCFQDISALLQNPDTCSTICGGDQFSQYSSYGYRWYDGYGNLIVSADDSNAYWVGGACPVQEYALKSLSVSSTTQTNTPPSHADSVKMNQANIKTVSQTKMVADADVSTGSGCATSNGIGNAWCGPLNRCGVWICDGYDGSGNRLPLSTPIVISRCITVPQSGTYYVGMGADNMASLQVDGVTASPAALYTNATTNFNYWNFFPINLTAGPHNLNIIAQNVNSYASVGVEIYYNTWSQISQASSDANLDVVFTTASLVGEPMSMSQYACPAGYTLMGGCNADSTPYCQTTVPAQWNINPYTRGFLGNFRQQAAYVYQTTRQNLVAQPAQNIPGATNIRTSGAYATFNPYWYYAEGTWNTSTDSSWVAAQTTTGFSQKGDMVESMDALGNYGSAEFGYLQSLPVAVATNAKYKEIAYDGFEDYNFYLNCELPSCSLYHFSFFPQLSSTVQLVQGVAHSGKYSLQLQSPVTITKTLYPDIPVSPFYIDANGGYREAGNQWNQGFSPVAGKQYLLSLWINDGQPRQATSATVISVDGSTITNTATNYPIVEGWKKVEIPFTIPAGSTTFSLTIQPAGTLYIDDIRICPFNSEMKTYAYDPGSQRLMAEMDENNFATFYEYDDEGILIRVKKETERGIMTIKETRSSYRY